MTIRTYTSHVTMLYRYLKQYRPGIAAAYKKNTDDHLDRIAAQLVWLFYECSRTNNVDIDLFFDWLIEVKDAHLGMLPRTGRPVMFNSLLPINVLEHPAYELLERMLLDFRPGKSQVGPLEFAACFLDGDNTFSVSNRAGYDIIFQQRQAEFKQDGNGIVDTVDKLRKYREDPRVQAFTIVRLKTCAKKHQSDDSRYTWIASAEDPFDVGTIRDGKLVFKHEPC